ncbi:MAG TPA: hypothetical protein VH796_00250 [Nitrososphaeraceae archaeon]|jgi:hypothetical protein
MFYEDKTNLIELFKPVCQAEARKRLSLRANTKENDESQKRRDSSRERKSYPVH